MIEISLLVMASIAAVFVFGVCSYIAWDIVKQEEKLEQQKTIFVV